MPAKRGDRLKEIGRRIEALRESAREMSEIIATLSALAQEHGLAEKG